MNKQWCALHQGCQIQLLPWARSGPQGSLPWTQPRVALSQGRWQWWFWPSDVGSSRYSADSCAGSVTEEVGQAYGGPATRAISFRTQQDPNSAACHTSLTEPDRMTRRPDLAICLTPLFYMVRLVSVLKIEHCLHDSIFRHFSTCRRKRDPQALVNFLLPLS